MDDPTASTTGLYKAEYASTGRAKCHYCKETITEGAFRVGPELKSQRWHRDYVRWFHYKCYQNAGLNFPSVDVVLGYEELQRDAQTFVRAMVKNTEGRSSSSGTSTASRAPTRSAAKPVVEPAAAEDAPRASGHKNTEQVRQAARKNFQQKMVEGDTIKTLEYIRLFPDLVNDQTIFTDNVSPLMFAVMRKNPHLVRQLLDRDADMSARDIRNDTALHKASRSADVNIVNILVRHGANIFARNDDMQKPLDIARSKNLSAIVKALEEAEGKSDNSTLSTPFKPTAASSSAAHVVPVGSSSEPSQMAPPRTSVNESAMATMSVAVHQLAQDANAMETTTVSAGRSSLKRAGGADTTSIDAGSKPKKVRVNSNPEWLAPVAAETAAGPSSTAAAADHEPLTKSSSNLTQEHGGLEWVNKDHRLRQLLVAGGFDSTEDLNKIATILRQEDIDYKALVIMNEADLTSINIRKGPRVKLLRGIKLMQDAETIPSVVGGVGHDMATSLPPSTITRTTAIASSTTTSSTSARDISPPTQFELQSLHYVKKPKPSSTLSHQPPIPQIQQQQQHQNQKEDDNDATQLITTPSPKKTSAPPPVALSVAAAPSASSSSARFSKGKAPMTSSPSPASNEPTSMSALIREIGQSTPEPAKFPQRITRSQSRQSQELEAVIAAPNKPITIPSREASAGLSQPQSIQDVFAPLVGQPSRPAMSRNAVEEDNDKTIIMATKQVQPLITQNHNVQNDELSMHSEMMMASKTFSISAWIVQKTPAAGSVSASDVQVSATFKRNRLRVPHPEKALEVVDAKTKQVHPGNTVVSTSKDTVQAVFTPTTPFLPNKAYSVNVHAANIYVLLDDHGGRAKGYYWNFTTTN